MFYIIRVKLFLEKHVTLLFSFLLFFFLYIEYLQSVIFFTQRVNLMIVDVKQISKHMRRHTLVWGPFDVDEISSIN